MPFDTSGDVDKFCKNCFKTFRENHAFGSGFCPKCRSKALIDTDNL